MHLSRSSRSVGVLAVGLTAVFAAALFTLYITLFRMLPGWGYDFSSFRGASIVLAHGGIPYHRADLLGIEQQELSVGIAYNPYYNPPLFATLLWPLTRLPFVVSYIVYTLLVVLSGIAGSLLTLRVLGGRGTLAWLLLPALISSPFFLTIWFGQQAAFLLLVVALGMLLLRTQRPLLCGMVLSLGLVKPHLLVPIVVCAAVLFAARAERLRFVIGFIVATTVLLILSLLTSGLAPLGAWISSLLQLSSHVEQVQNNLPSLGGTMLVLLPSPINRVAAVAVMAVAIIAMGWLCVAWRTVAPHERLAVASVVWLMTVPYVHTPDLVLALPALFMLWNRRGIHVVSLCVLWAYMVLPFAYPLPVPWRLVDLLPLPCLLAALVIKRPPAAVVPIKGHIQAARLDLERDIAS